MGKAGSSCPFFNQHLVLRLLYPAAVPFFKKWIYLRFFLPSLAPFSFIPQCLLSSPPALSYKHGYPRYPSSQGKSGAVNLIRPITFSHSSRKFLSSPLCQHTQRHHEAAPGVYILVLSKGQDVFWHVQAPFLVDIDRGTCPDTTVMRCDVGEWSGVRHCCKAYGCLLWAWRVSDKNSLSKFPSKGLQITDFCFCFSFRKYHKI